MRWPKVRPFAAAYGCLMPLAAFAGFIGLAGWAQSAPAQIRPWLLGVLVLTWLGVGASLMVFPACPRCGRSPFLRGKRFKWFGGIARLCNGCGLDLRKARLFDDPE